MSKNFDVIINGCGPTGLTLALLLAQSGHDIAIVDRHPSIYPLPRAIAYDHEIARILNKLGLHETMQPLVAIPGAYQWRDDAGELLFELNWADQTSISGFPASYLFSQPDLESVLDQTARDHPQITMLRGVEVDRCTQDACGVLLCGTNSEGDAVRLAGRWLVGADGANSLVRTQMGSELEDLGFRADWLVVDVRPRPGHALPLDDDLMLQVCDPARPTTVVSGGPGRRRWEFMALAGETLDDLNSAERAWALLAPWGVTADNGVLERHAVYTFRGAIATQWRQGRAFLAGDAAHLTPPFAGQGLCAGFRDAASLAWRLDLALKGLASDALLASYETERKAHARAWVMNAIDLGKVICVLDPAAAAARNAGMKAARAAGTAPPASAILPHLGAGTHLADHHGGTLAAGGAVDRLGTRGHLDDIIGTGFILISRHEDPAACLSRRNADLVAAIGAICVDMSPSGTVRDSSGAFSRWFDALGADTVLVRPDFYVFGAGIGPGAADSLVDALGTWMTLQVRA